MFSYFYLVFLEQKNFNLVNTFKVSQRLPDVLEDFTHTVLFLLFDLNFIQIF